MLTNTAIIIHTSQYPSHTDIAGMLVNTLSVFGVSCTVIDIGDGDALHKQFGRIKSQSPQLIISLDMAGTEMRTESGRLAYNQLPCRMAYFLLQPLDTYSCDRLNQPFNFSMFFFTAGQSDAALLAERYPDLPNISHLPLADRIENPDMILSDMLTRMELLPEPAL